MAKKQKMSRKLKIVLSAVLTVFATLLGVVCVILLAAPGLGGISGKLGKIDDISLANITFGGGSFGVGKTAFSFLNFLPLVLVVLGVIILVLSIVFKHRKLLPFVAAVLFLGAGVLYFCAMSFVSFDLSGISEALQDTTKEAYRKLISEGYSLGAGAITAGVLSILSAISSVLAGAFKQR